MASDDFNLSGFLPYRLSVLAAHKPVAGRLGSTNGRGL